MVCPCDLFMVIAKLSLTENCFLLSTKGSPELAFVFNLILGKNALFLALLLVRISISNIFLNKPRHNYRVSLHRPYLGSMFRNNIKGAHFITFKICGGILPWEIEFRNSCRYGCVAICFFLPYLSIFNPPVLFPLLFDFFAFYIVITNYDITPGLWITYTPHIMCLNTCCIRIHKYNYPKLCDFLKL